MDRIAAEPTWKPTWKSAPRLANPGLSSINQWVADAAPLKSPAKRNISTTSHISGFDSDSPKSLNRNRHHLGNLYIRPRSYGLIALIVQLFQCLLPIFEISPLYASLREAEESPFWGEAYAVPLTLSSYFRPRVLGSLVASTTGETKSRTVRNIPSHPHICCCHYTSRAQTHSFAGLG